jgi:hypothetical protein
MLTDGNVTVEVSADATVRVIGLGGQRLQSRAVYAGTPLTLDLSRYRKGFYLISIKTASGETITRKVILDGSLFYFTDYLIGRPDEKPYHMTVGATGVKVYQNLAHAVIFNANLSMNYRFEMRRYRLLHP